MPHPKSAHETDRRRRVGALTVVAVLLVAACSDSKDDATAVSSVQHTTVPGATPDAPGSVSTDATGSTGDELPTLPDVTLPEWTPKTRTDELVGEVVKEPTPQLAVDAFALLYPDMPGATPSDLPPGDGLDATYTWMMIRYVYDRLAADQRAVVDEASAGVDVGRIDDNGAVTTTDSADEEIPDVGDPPPDTTATGDTVVTIPTESTAESTVEPGGFVAQRPRGPKQTYKRYVKLAAKVLTEWRAHRPDLPTYEIKVKIGTKRSKHGGMDTGADSTTPHQCIVTVDPGFVAANNPDSVIKFFFAHEFFHCVQFQWNEPATWNWPVAQWVFDGSADFAAADLYRGNFTAPPGILWQNWFTDPTMPLAQRTYDAWAIFETEMQRGVDPYPMIKSMVVTSPNGNPSHDLGPLNELFFRMDWASHSYRSTQHPAADWQLNWPGPSPTYGPRETAGRSGSRGLGSWDVKINGGFIHPTLKVDVDSDVGIVDVTPSSGPLTTETAAGVIHIPEGASVRLCFSDDGCKCPEDSDSDAQQMAGHEMIFSFAASENPTSAHAEAQKWDKKAEQEKCKKKKPKRGSSNGDPHLVTFDGDPFDMMSLGEFVTSRDPAGDFEVQTRNIGSPGVGGTLSSAVAIKAGTKRITFTITDIAAPDGLVVRVDGEPTTEMDLDLDGITVHRRDTADALLTWPDGTTVDLRFEFGYFVTITPSDARASQLDGMLGAPDGDFLNDLRMPDGTIVDPVNASIPDGDFAKAWQVTKDNTLFDYDAGQSVETFALPYPGDAFQQLIDQATQEQCTLALGPNAASYEIASCAYDVSVTGNDAYVESYQQVVEARVDAEDDVVDEEETPPPGSVATPTSTGIAVLTLSGSLVASFADNAGPDNVYSLNGTVAAKSGTVMIFRAERCAAAATLFMTVTNHDTAQSGGLFICDPSNTQAGLADEDDEAVPGEVYMWMPATGDYDITIDTDAEDASFVSVDVFVDPEPTIVDGDDVVKNGYSGTLHGIGDTVVITSPDTGASFTATGLGTACAQEAYGADPVGHDSIWPLAAFCAHADTVSLPGYDVPLVLFSRTADSVEIGLTPA